MKSLIAMKRQKSKSSCACTEFINAIIIAEFFLRSKLQGTYFSSHVHGQLHRRLCDCVWDCPSIAMSYMYHPHFLRLGTHTHTHTQYVVVI